MCPPVLVAGLASLALSKVLTPSPPKMAPPPEPVKPPQQAQMPDQQAMRTSQKAATSGRTGGPSAATTWLTGIGGVSPGALNLGKTTLLGE